MPPAPQPPAPRPPTREEIIANIRQQNSGHLIEQIIELEADKAVLVNELITAKRRIKELETKLSAASIETVEPK